MSTSNSASFFQAVMESRPPIAHDAAFFNKHLVNFDSRRTRERLQSVCGKRLYANFHAEEQLHSTSDATPTAKVQLLQSITNDQVKYPTSSDCTVQKIRSLQKCNNKLRREVESLKATLASQSASLSALESRCVEYASGWKSTYSLWEEIYSGAFAEDCKYGYSLTDKQLNGARNELSMLWDARRGRYVRRSIPNTTCELFPKGLLVPKIPNAKTLRNEVSVYADDLGFRDCVDGRGALISASKAVVFALAEAGSLVTGARQVQIIGDGHEALRTYGLVNVCARGIHSGAFFNALATMNRCALVEGSDSFQNKNLREVYSGLAALIQNGGVYIPEENGGETFVPVDFLGGGDMVYINEIMGCVSDFDSNSGGFCCWCECSYGDLHILPDLKKSNGRPTRTLRRQFWSAHLPLPVWLLSPGETQFPFKCPHCCAHFRNEEDVHDDKQRHSMDSQDDQKKFAKLHYGQNHGRESLLPIEPMKFIGCALHLQLSVMRTLWEDAVCVHLTGHTKQQRVDAVNSKLSELRVHPRCHVGWSSASEKQRRKAKFTGPEAAIVLDNWDELVDLAIPSTLSKDHNLIAKELGDEWKQLYNVLQRRVTAADNSSRPLEMLNQKLCTCCKVKYVVTHCEGGPRLPTFRSNSVLDLDSTKTEEKHWRKSREKFNLCQDCILLSWRKRAAVRRQRREQIQKEIADGAKCLYNADELQQRKNQKADEVFRRALSFCKNIKKIIPSRHTYYLHALVWHFPTWIQSLDVDVFDISGSGIEQINLETKRFVRDHSNHHVVTNRNARFVTTRCAQALKHLLKRKSTRSHHLRLNQLMVKDHMKRLPTNGTRTQSEMFDEKRRKSRILAGRKWDRFHTKIESSGPTGMYVDEVGT